MDASVDVIYNVWLLAFLPPEARSIFTSHRTRDAIRTALKQRYPTNDVARFFQKAQNPAESVTDFALAIRAANVALELNQTDPVLINIFCHGLYSPEL